MLAPSPHTHVLLLLRKALFAVRQRLSFAYFICEAMRYLDGREIAEGDVQQVFLLSDPANTSRTLWLPHPIRNNKVDRNGKLTAWVMNQRYVRSTVLLAVAARDGKTSAVDDARFSK